VDPPAGRYRGSDLRHEGEVVAAAPPRPEPDAIACSSKRDQSETVMNVGPGEWISRFATELVWVVGPGGESLVPLP
jgi:hypothetical protein